MANSYVAPNFDIDTSCNVADLITLKGSAIATTDWIYISNNATVTLEQDISFASFYIGDNVAGTAGTKKGHVVQDAGISCTFNSAVTHKGYDGEGTTSTITINGTAASPCTVTGNTINVMSNANCSGNLITATHTTFVKFFGFLFKAAHSFMNCTFLGCQYALYFDANNRVRPASLDGCLFKGCLASIYDITTTNPVAPEWGNFLVYNKIRCQGDNTYQANGMSQFNYRFGVGAGAITRYVLIWSSSTPINYHKNLRKTRALVG